LLWLSSCENDDEGMPPEEDPDIVALAQSVSDLSTLVQAVQIRTNILLF
jgi:hypothetical protein